MELDASNQRREQLEKALSERKNTSHLTQKSTQSLLEKTEAALKKVNETLRCELEQCRADLERERDALRQNTSVLSRMKAENATMKRRLDDRDNLIQMALSKLEV